MQQHGAGWVFTNLREMLADRVFEKLYGTKRLHTSKDGFAFVRPNAATNAQTPGGHFDQGSDMVGLQCIQASVALTDPRCRQCRTGHCSVSLVFGT